MARIARLGVVIDSSGAKKGADETTTALRSIESTAKRAEDALKKAAATLGVAFGVRALQQAVDQYTLLDARLKQVTGSGAAFARVQQELFTIAQNSRASYAATVDLYTRLARSSDQLGISQGQLVSVTEAVSNAVRLSNASTGAAEAGLVQLGQAFASGTLRGDELRSIMEQLPAVAKAIADGLGVPIGKLREMGEAGELSGRKVALALESQREKLALLAGEIPTTIGQALQQLNNAFGMVVAGSDEAKSATAGIAGVIGETARFMVEYKNAVIAVTVALGAGGLVLAASKAAAAITATAGAAAIANYLSLATAVTTAGEAFAFLRYGATLAWAAITGPIGLAIAGVTAVAAAVYFWRTRQHETTEAVKATAKSAQELYDEAKKLAAVNWAPSSQLAQIQNLGGALQAARTGGKQAAAAFQQAAEQWKDSGDKARTFAQALAEGDQKATTLLATTRAQLALGAQVEATLDAQAKAQRDKAKATEEAQQVEADYQTQVVQLGIELADRARVAQADYTEALRAASAAYATLIVAGGQANAQLSAQVSALLQGGAAYAELTRQQQLNAAITAALNDAATKGVALTPQVVGAIVAQTAETERLKRVKEALLALNGQNPFAIPTEETRRWGESLTTVTNTARDLAQIFGNVGTQITRAVQLAAQLVQSVRAASEAAKTAETLGAGKPGSADAARASRGANLAAGASFLTASVSIITAWSSAVRRSAEEAERLAVALRDQRLAAVNSAQAFIGSGRTGLQSTLDGITAQFNDVIRGLLAAGAPSVARLGGRTARSVVPTADDVNKVIDAYDAMIAKAKEAAAFQLAQAQGELDARLLVAQGRTAEADALRLQLAQAKELRDAEAQFGADSPYLAHLKTVQAAETAAAQAAEARRQTEQARERTAFGLDLTQRRQTLNGDSRGAFITGQTIAGNSALAEAQRLVEAGIITAAMFEELKVLIGDEMTQAIADFDAAAAESVLQQREDLEVRALVAQGRNAEAAQRRIEIANRRELQGVTDEATRAEIIRVQVLEEAARVAEAAAEAERRRTEQNTDITRRMIDAYRILDPAKAAELEATQLEIDRTNELANAADDATRARLRELYAMQDAAKAAQALATEMDRQRKIAEELASFTSSLNVQYLRSQGRSFDAGVAELDEWRTEQRKRAAQVGAGPGALAQIDAIYASRYSELVKQQMGMNEPIRTPDLTSASAGGRGDNSTVLGEDTVAVRSARSITEATALQLVDYAASQTALLRRLVQLAEGGSGPTGNTLVSPSLDLVDRQLGARANTASLLLAGSVR